MNSTPLRQLSGLMKACADPTRLRIVGLLRAGELCVCRIHECLRISQPKASRHLAYLRRAGLVRTRRRGSWIYYRLTDDTSMQPVISALAGCLRHCDATRGDLKRLKAAGVCPSPAGMGASLAPATRARST